MDVEVASAESDIHTERKWGLRLGCVSHSGNSPETAGVLQQVHRGVNMPCPHLATQQTFWATGVPSGSPQWSAEADVE